MAVPVASKTPIVASTLKGTILRLKFSVSQPRRRKLKGVRIKPRGTAHLVRVPHLLLLRGSRAQGPGHVLGHPVDPSGGQAPLPCQAACGWVPGCTVGHATRSRRRARRRAPTQVHTTGSKEPQSECRFLFVTVWIGL